MGPSWKDEEWCPETKHPYRRIRKSTMESWLNNTQIMATLTQTHDTKTIHPKQHKEMLIPKQKLQTQWEIRSNAIQERAPKQGWARKKIQNTPRQRKTDIMKLVEKHSEMTGEQEPNIEGRKQLAATMLEYPTRQDGQEEEAKEGDHRMYYTCIRRKNPPKTPIGKTNRLRHASECAQVHQKEDFANRRQECHRNFRCPAELREQRKYIFTLQARSTRDSENANKEKGNHEIENGRKQQETEEGKPITGAQSETNTMWHIREGNGYARHPGHPRQPRESAENRNGILRYEADTETWRCAKCEKSFAAIDARGEEAHAETHATSERNIDRNKNNRRYSNIPSKMQMTSG